MSGTWRRVSAWMRSWRITRWIFEHYPDLGKESVSYEDSISREFYELEREAIFKRSWLNVGRVAAVDARSHQLAQQARALVGIELGHRGSGALLRHGRGLE